MSAIFLWYLGEFVKVLGTAVAIFAGIVAAWKAIAEWKRATLQRADELKQRELELHQQKQEFRQKQALFAREIIKDIFDDKRARNALTMLDFREDEYEDINGARYEVERPELKPALCDSKSEDEDKAIFIKRCFESLYDHLEQVENLLEVGVLNVEDIAPAFRYYMQKALHGDIQHLEFFDAFDYPKAKRFAMRFAKS
jgi:hypothetical protein